MAYCRNRDNRLQSRLGVGDRGESAARKSAAGRPTGQRASARVRRLVVGVVGLFFVLILVGGAAAQLRFGVADESGVFAADGGAAFFSQLRDLGMSDDRFTVKWDPAQPETIPDRAFLDRAIPVAAAHGIQIVFAVYPTKANAITSSPDAGAQFARFLQLVARTYSPSAVIVGDEPNQPRFWQPQFDPNGKPVAGAAYEVFLAQAYDALKAMNPGITVVGAGPSSRGNDNPNAKNNRSTSPVRFIHDLGVAYRQSGRTKPIMDQFGFHPYPQQNTDPATKDYQWPKIGISNLPRLKQAVWDAFHGTAQPTFAENGAGGALTLMIDEVGWQVGVNSSLYTGNETVPTISEATQAQTYTDLIRVGACDPSVTDLLLFQLVDETDLDRFQSGLIRADGSQRPAYQAVKDAIAATGGQCAGPPATWQHTSAVDNAYTNDCAPGAHTPEQTYWSLIVRADEDTTYRAGIFKLPNGKETLSHAALARAFTSGGDAALAANGTAQAYNARLVRFTAHKLRPGTYICAARLSSAMNPERSTTLISEPFAVGGKGGGTDSSPQVLGASTDDYPWSNAPCEFPSGGSSCANPNKPKDDVYDWYLDSDGNGRVTGANEEKNNTCGTNPLLKECFDRWGYEYRNCTSYVAWRLSQAGVKSTLFNGLGNASEWLNKVNGKPGVTTGRTPKPGAIAIWTSGFGHAAFVEPTSGGVLVSDYNKAGTGKFWGSHAMTPANGYKTAPSGYIYFPGVQTGPPPPPPDTKPPTAPTGLTWSTVGSSSSVTLHWQPAHDNVGVHSYTFFLNGNQVGSALATGTSYTFTSVNCAILNTLGVRAEDAAGNKSGIASTPNNVMLTGCLRAQAMGKIVTVTVGDPYTSYVYDGGLHWIPDANTYWCVLDGGRQVYNVSSQALANALGNGQPWQRECLSVRRVFGHIVRERTSGASYIVTDDHSFTGVWHWIPDGGTYNCLIKTMSKIDADWTEINWLRQQGGVIHEGAHATCGNAQPPPPASGPIFTVLNTSETLPDGIWFRNSPHTADTDRVTGHGVYKNERVQLHCYAWGDAVGAYANRLWFQVTNVTRPSINGRPNTGFLNAHYINDGKLANQVDAGVPAC